MKSLSIVGLLASATPVFAQQTAIVNVAPLVSEAVLEASLRALIGGAQVRVRL